MNGRRNKPSPGLLILDAVLFSACLMGGRAIAENALSRHVPAVVTNLNLQPIGHLPVTQPLNLSISLPWRNQQALTNLLQDIYSPASRNFRHYLTPQQFAEQFGPTSADYEAVAAFARAKGLTVTGRHPNRMILDVSGPAVAMEQAFHIKLLTYHHPTEARDFYAPNAEPSLDVAVPVLHIGGLDNFAPTRPLVQMKALDGAAPDLGSGTNGSYMGDDFRAAYASNISLTGAGQTVGLLEFDGYYAADIAAYESQAGLPNVPLTNVLLDGFSGTPSNFDGCIEVSLDIEDAISMAPGLSQVVVYEAGSGGNWDDMLNRMATDDLAEQMSSSWYKPGGEPDPVADQIFEQMETQGQSMFQASGDYNAYTGLISFPCDNPYITLVGGTELTTSGPGGTWVSETVWNQTNAGSGGGVSTSYSIPTWQQDVNMSGNQGSTTMRNVPDVALTAYNVDVIADNGGIFVVGGTSCAAPLWAGFTALVNQQAATSYLPSVGFLNPSIYMLGLGTNYDACMNDIVTGNDTNKASPDKFFAEPGYDLCTGWGTPAGQNLLNALTQINQPGPPTIIAQPQSQTIAYNDTATFYVQATGTFPLNFQWNYNGTNIPGATGARLVLSNALPAQSGSYDVFITNSTGSTLSSNAILTVEPPVGPVITTQPNGQQVALNQTVIFNVAATGTAPLSYQWSFNGTNLIGATNDELVISNVQASQAGLYAVQVSNIVDVVASSNAGLSVFPGWLATSAAANQWSGIASSSNGTMLAATVDGGFIYTSSNSGGTWARSGALSENWIAIASSTDGSALVALVEDGPIYVSTNAGGTWKKTNVATNAWAGIASSANGTDLAAIRKESSAFLLGSIYLSANEGSIWQDVFIADAMCPMTWASVASSANGVGLIAAQDNGLIYMSTNSGSTWVPATAPTNKWSSVASSANGTQLVAVAHTGNPLCEQNAGNEVYNGPIYTSANAGTTWTEANAPSNDWISVASSADGSKLIVAAENGPIYVSTDSGADWLNSGAPTNDWKSVAASADGNTFMAVAGGDTGQIYLWQMTPTLGMTFSTNTLNFSWPIYWNGAVLQQDTDLTTTNWTTVTNSQSVNNGMIQLTLTPPSGNAFYRLSYP